MMVQAEGGGGGRWRRGFPAVIFIKLKGGESMKGLEETMNTNSIVWKMNGELKKLVDMLKAVGLTLNVEFVDSPKQGVAIQVSAQSTGETAKKAITSRSRMALGERIFVFVNDYHNPDLVLKEMSLWGLGEREVEFIHTGDDVRGGFQELYDCLEEGDTVMVGTIADFLSSDTLLTVDTALDWLEELGILLISHLEFGCSYAELRARIQTAMVLEAAMNDEDLEDFD